MHDIKATHLLVTLTKFHYNWAKIVDFYYQPNFLARVIFFFTVSIKVLKNQYHLLQEVLELIKVTQCNTWTFYLYSYILQITISIHDSVCCVCLYVGNSYCLKFSANPITLTPIWKWEFEKFLFKFPFLHKGFQMGQKMYFYQLYKL